MALLLANVFQSFKCISRNFVASAHVPQSTSIVKPQVSLLTLVRTKVRCYFPRPNEVRRVRRHGWAQRMSTPNGRRIIMRRILKVESSQSQLY